MAAALWSIASDVMKENILCCVKARSRSGGIVHEKDEVFTRMVKGRRDISSNWFFFLFEFCLDCELSDSCRTIEFTYLGIVARLHCLLGIGIHLS